MGPAQRAKKFLQSKGLHSEAAALDRVVCGSAAVALRSATVDTPPMCSLCGGLDDWVHHYITCPKIPRLHDPEGCLRWSSPFFREIAGGWHRNLSAVWCRGLLPEHVIQADTFRTFQPHIKMLQVGNFSETASRAEAIHTDGSGGERWVYLPLRKAGAAAITIAHHPDRPIGVEDFAMRLAAIPGAQTVPRAETVAANIALADNLDNSSTHLVVDASYVSDGLKRHHVDRCSLLRNRNGDLWHELYGTQDVNAPAATRKVASHSTFGSIIAGHISWQDYIGNSVADFAADAMAKASQPQGIVLQHAGQWDTYTFVSCLRAAIIEKAHTDLKPRLVAPPILPP